MIAIDLTLATRSEDLTGVERFGINVARAWPEPDKVVAFVSPGVQLPGLRCHVPAGGSPLAAWLALPRELSRHGIDKAVFPSFPPSPLFLGSRTRLSRVIHDVVPFARADTMPLKGRLIFRHLEKQLLPRYAAIHAPTAVVQEELSHFFPRLTVSVCGNAPGLDVDSPTRAAVQGVAAGRYLLAVGTAEPRKNYERLVELFTSSNTPFEQLIIVGRPAWGGVADTLAAAAANDPRVIWVKDADDSQLRWLYANCAQFVSLSLAEGFNMPLVEAGCFGRPIIASDIPIHRSVAAAWTRFVPLDLDAPAFSNICNAATTPADAAEYRRKFSWRHVAENLAAL